MQAVVSAVKTARIRQESVLSVLLVGPKHDLCPQGAGRTGDWIINQILRIRMLQSEDRQTTPIQRTFDKRMVEYQTNPRYLRELDSWSKQTKSKLPYKPTSHLCVDRHSPDLSSLRKRPLHSSRCLSWVTVPSNKITSLLKKPFSSTKSSTDNTSEEESRLDLWK